MVPPEPWELHGRMYLSVFAVPRAALPPLPAGVRPVPLGRRALVGAAWVQYEPGGVLHYRELLAAVLVHERGRPRVTITDIWVDSVASRDGGRALWGIPKDLAELTIRPGDGGGAVMAASTTAAPRPIGAATFRAGLCLPGRWPTRMTVVQALHGGLRRTPVRGRTGVRLGSATWRLDANGPLGFLAGRRPLLTLVLTGFRLRFGARAGSAVGGDRDPLPLPPRREA
jgi:Acetoacetate decarboxylase (ADC)